MGLELLGQGVDRWQFDAFNQIKSDLFATKAGKSIEYGDIAEKHIVSIYGKSQIGKTTLILNMLGLKDEKSLDEVYETLRGGVRLGNSSTSTAIIYSKSPCEQYGISVSDVNGSQVCEIFYVDKDTMTERIKEIRKDVEARLMNADEIIRIMIPSHYFLEDDAVNHIAILDLPGINSSNLQERPHVEALMARFIPLSSVCMIVRESSDIQSLEKMVLPTEVDWKNLPHRFVIAVTHAYNDDSVRRYFKELPEKRDKPFYDFVRELYSKKIKDIIGSEQTDEGKSIEIYPIEIGQSFSTLCNKNLNRKKDVQEVMQTRDRTLRELRGSIVSHKGQRLIAAIEDLTSLVKNFDEPVIMRYETDIAAYKKEIESYKETITESEEVIQAVHDDMDSCEKRLDDYNKLNTKIEKLLSLEQVKKDYSKLFCEAIDNNVKIRYEKDSRTYIDNEKELIEVMKSCASWLITDCVKEAGADINERELSNDVSSFIEKEIRSLIYPEESNKAKELLRVLLSKNMKVKKILVTSASSSIAERLFEKMNENIISPSKEKVANEISAEKKELHQLKKIFNNRKKRIKKATNDMRLKGDLIEQCKRGIEATRIRQKKDNETLKSYLDYARKAFENQRNEVLVEINSKHVSAEEKMVRLLFLCLLDKDYNSVIK